MFAMSQAPSRIPDVLGFGCAAVDDVLVVPSYPGPDAKTRVVSRERHFGGLTGAALVTAARMGACCGYAGCLGEDDASAWVAGIYRDENIDISTATHLPEATVVQSAIIVAQDTGLRSVLFSCEGLIGAHPAEPAEAVIRAAKVVLIDHFGMAGNLRVARIARAAGVAVVADFEDAADPLFPEVLELVDHLILSVEMALGITGRTTPAEAASALWREDRAAVIVTCGAEGCWAVAGLAAPEPRHHPALPIKAVDTNGCGDVFHGAYAAALARGLDLAARIRLATAAAAVKASQAVIPDLETVQKLLAADTGTEGNSFT